MCCIVYYYFQLEMTRPLRRAGRTIILYICPLQARASARYYNGMYVYLQRITGKLAANQCGKLNVSWPCCDTRARLFAVLRMGGGRLASFVRNPLPCVTLACVLRTTFAVTDKNILFRRNLYLSLLISNI